MSKVDLTTNGSDSKAVPVVSFVAEANLFVFVAKVLRAYKMGLIGGPGSHAVPALEKNSGTATSVNKSHFNFACAEVVRCTSEKS